MDFCRDAENICQQKNILGLADQRIHSMYVALL